MLTRVTTGHNALFNVTFPRRVLFDTRMEITYKIETKGRCIFIWFRKILPLYFSPLYFVKNTVKRVRVSRKTKRSSDAFAIQFPARKRVQEKRGTRGWAESEFKAKK